MSTKFSVIWSPCVDFHQGIANAVAILALNMSFMLTDFHLKGFRRLPSKAVSQRSYE